MIVALDGVTGSGKSTLCKRVAAKLNFTYIRTGSFYRAIAYKMLSQKIDKTNLPSIKKLLKSTKIESNFNGENITILLDGKHVKAELNSPEVSSFVSQIAPIKEIRDYVSELQKNTAKNYDNIIMEGRDIGSVIFPNAELKIYLDCNIDERARRRVNQYAKDGITANVEEIKQAILKRDQEDSQRKLSPLVRLPEAFYLDTTNYTMDQCVDIIYNLIKFVQNKK